MLYSNVYIDAFGYELPPNVLTSEDIEKRLEPLYKTLHFQKGQLEALTGIQERRYWDPGFKVSTGAIMAGRKALEFSRITPDDIGMLIYGGVCRDNLEPATACAVSDGLGLGPETLVYDVSNACLGILNGMVQVANAIELGQIQAGMVVSCESSRQIIDLTIDRMVAANDMETFKKTVATLTGGSGAVAVILTAGTLSDQGHQLLGGVARSATQHHALCTWGPDTGIPASGLNVMQTDSVGVLQNGVTLGIDTFTAFQQKFHCPLTNRTRSSATRSEQPIRTRFWGPLEYPRKRILPLFAIWEISVPFRCRSLLPSDQNVNFWSKTTGSDFWELEVG